MRALRGALAAGLALVLAPAAVRADFEPSGKLEIHYINVGQGGCTLVIGPDGTRILYDFGKVGGKKNIVPYLKDAVGLAPADGVHFTMVSHRDLDHYAGYKDVVRAGYQVLVANYGPGSPKDSTTIRSAWLDEAEKTTAGAVQPIPVGLPIALGDGAFALVMAANGRVYGDPEPVEVDNENDRSIALFIGYGDFQYVLDGDLGAGPEDCTAHDDMGQVDVQSRVAQALLDLGWMDAELGVDVMHVSHHGSESSTSSTYYDLVRPEVGLISVGLKQGSFLHPRVDVVEGVLVGEDRFPCVDAPALLALFQTEDGAPGSSSTGATSFAGRTIGDIKLETDGRTGYTITGSYRVHGWTERPPDLADDPEPFVQHFDLDEVQP